MSTENEEKDGKDMTELHQELIAIESEETGETANVDGEASPSAGKVVKKEPAAADDGEDETDEDEESGETGDQRASNEAEGDAADDEQRKKARETSAARRKRQREAREKLERTLKFYERRNEELERRFSGLEENQRITQRLSIQQAIDKAREQLNEARRIEADALSQNDGTNAIEARDLASKFEQRVMNLERAKARAEAPVQRRVETTPPPEMEAAYEWITRNSDWYDPNPNSKDRNTLLAVSLENAMTNEGRFDPRTPEFWKEFDKQLRKYGIGKSKSESQIVDDEDDDDDNEPSHGSHRRASDSKTAGERTDARKPGKGGPKISVGGSSRTLKANEVYIDPGRKNAMIELGIWDDPEAKQRMLKRYQQFDREEAAKGR